MENRRAIGSIGIVAIAAILTVSIVAFSLSQSAVAAPANKTSFGGEGVGAIPSDGMWHTITYGEIKTSTPSDLLVAHNQECAIHTGLNLDKLNQDLTSAIREDVRLKVTTAAGEVRYINPVPLYPEVEAHAAVTMCGMAYHIDTNILLTIFELCQFANGIVPDTCTEEEPFFNSYIRTKSTHGWDWVVPNLGSGVHTIEVQAMLIYELDAVGDGTGKKGKATNTTVCDPVELSCVDTILEVGKRSLIVTEEKFASSI